MADVSTKRAQLAGFTVLELLVVVTLIGIVSGSFVFVVNTGNWRRQRVNAVANELAGWIEEVMAYSMRENVRCDIQITAGTYAAGETAAQVIDAGAGVCLVREPNFRIPAVVAPATDRFVIGPVTTTVTYTPRGSVTNIADTPVAIALRPSGGGAQPPVRCVRISATLGLISIGRNDAASTTTAAVANNCTFDFI